MTMLKAIKRRFAHPNEDQAPKLEPRIRTGKHADGELAKQAVAFDDEVHALVFLLEAAP